MQKMTVKSILVTSTILSLLVGCASDPTPEQIEKLTLFRSTSPVCNNEKDCAAKWEAAQLWVVNNAGYKIQTISNVVIETFNSTNYSQSLAVRVTKSPLGEGKYKISAQLWCDSSHGCRPDAIDAGLDFNKTVGSTKP